MKYLPRTERPRGRRLRGLVLLLAILAAVTLVLACPNPGVPDEYPDSGKFLVGSGAPAGSFGQDGDLYLDTGTSVLYVKLNGAWDDIATLKGDPGAAGSQWFTGTAIPAAALGADGDFYLNTTTSVVFQKVQGVWTVVVSLQGPTGTNGATWLSGIGAPGTSLGMDGDFYLDTQNSVIYQKASGAWATVLSLQGAAGGRTWLSGGAPPTADLGIDGDMYLDTQSTIVYQKVAGVWTALVTLQGSTGPTGAPGSPGSPGTDGNTWYTGSTDPLPGLGADGDLYLNTTSTVVFTKSGGAWTSVVALRGPAGPQGPVGEPGSPGLSIVWMGMRDTPPSDPTVNMAYYNTALNRSEIWNGSSWQILAVDGLSIMWQGMLPYPPEPAFENYAYYNILEGKSFIYHDGYWEILAIDGAQGPPGPGVTWEHVTADVQAESNKGYLADSISLITITLPPSPALGDIVEVTGISSGMWKVAQNEGQSIVSNSGALVKLSSTLTARESSRAWWGAASSADGMKLAAIVQNGYLYTSIDAGATWAQRGTARNWTGIASSSDGSRLVATVGGGHIYTSNDGGVTWTQRASSQNWSAVASSADGSRLVAVVNAGYVYTSEDFGESWTSRWQERAWWGIASSSDGMKLVATVNSEYIYTSTDGGVNWSNRAIKTNWTGVASSADGTKLVALNKNGAIYTSTDSGAHWTSRAANDNWWAVASSSDGTRLVAVANSNYLWTSSDSGISWTADGVLGPKPWSCVTCSANGTVGVAGTNVGMLYCSTLTYVPSTTMGPSGSIDGERYGSVELQFIGSGRWVVTGHEGVLLAQ